MKNTFKIIVASLLLGSASGCIRFKTPTHDVEIDATMLVPAEETVAE